MSGYPDDKTVGRQPMQQPPHYQQPPNYQQPSMQQQYGYEQPYGHGFGPPPWAMRARRQYPIETKPFFLTSEFIGAVLAIAGIAITAASSDAFGAWRAWILITAVIVGYMVSRGIAKSGTRSHADDPRENFNPSSWGRGGSGGQSRSGGSRLRSTEQDDDSDDHRY